MYTHMVHLAGLVLTHYDNKLLLTGEAFVTSCGAPLNDMSITVNPYYVTCPLCRMSLNQAPVITEVVT